MTIQPLSVAASPFLCLPLPSWHSQLPLTKIPWFGDDWIPLGLAPLQLEAWGGLGKHDSAGRLCWWVSSIPLVGRPGLCHKVIVLNLFAHSFQLLIHRAKGLHVCLHIALIQTFQCLHHVLKVHYDCECLFFHALHIGHPIFSSCWQSNGFQWLWLQGQWRESVPWLRPHPDYTGPISLLFFSNSSNSSSSRMWPSLCVGMVGGAWTIPSMCLCAPFEDRRLLRVCCFQVIQFDLLAASLGIE